MTTMADLITTQAIVEQVHVRSLRYLSGRLGTDLRWTVRERAELDGTIYISRS